jgi:hypothetical protein
MTDKDLEKLLEEAKRVRMSASQAESQRRSFAYGNTHFENERITKAMVDRAADELALDHESKD